LQEHREPLVATHSPPPALVSTPVQSSQSSSDTAVLQESTGARPHVHEGSQFDGSPGDHRSFDLGGQVEEARPADSGGNSQARG